MVLGPCFDDGLQAVSIAAVLIDDCPVSLLAKARFLGVCCLPEPLIRGWMRCAAVSVSGPAGLPVQAGAQVATLNRTIRPINSA